MENIIALFEGYFGKCPDQVELLPASGSARKYYRMSGGGATYIGTCHQNLSENDLFINFSRHFRAKDLHAPEIYCVSEDHLAYLQEDFGDTMLLDVVVRERRGELLNSRLIELYKKSLSELLRFQHRGNEGLDYSHCMPRPVFDRQCILWDLNYFKYCFLRLAGAEFSEQAMEDDFNRLADCLCEESTDSFMLRDFQSRNIMVRDEDVWFIDYQGGRQGALQYDVASLLYDAIACIPEMQREELLDYYMTELQKYRAINAESFRACYYRFALIRLLQAMGAFGLRGLYEKKQHFIDSIVPGLRSISELFESGKLADDYPAICSVIRQLRDRN